MTGIYQSFTQAHSDINELAAIDYFFAKEMLLALSVKQQQQHLLQGIFFSLSASLRAGHTCLAINELANSQWGTHSKHNLSNRPSNSTKDNCNTDLSEISNESLGEQHALQGFSFPDFAQLNNILTELNITEHDAQPIVYKNNKLYLRRYFQFESELSAFIGQRLHDNSMFSIEKIQQSIEKLFPDDIEENSGNDLDVSSLDWQKIAVANAINKNFSVIAGGPGTGKTYTVTKLLAALVMLHAEHNAQYGKQNSKPLAIALVAPTGKAAQRLSESIVNAVTGFKGLIADDVLAAIPSNAQTIHRLLGVISNNANFRHNQKNLLPYDIVLIDEVSMVDLPLMTRIFRALKADAKVILLGDADQLPSVAAGSVLADIAPRPHGGYSDINVEYLAKTCQISKAILLQSFSDVVSNKADYLTFLIKSRRFDGQGGIGLLANAVIAGDSRTSWQLLTETTKDVRQGNQVTQGNSAQLSLATSALNEWLSPLVKQYYQPIECCDDIHQAFALLAKFRVLCATRQGDYGVESINEKIKVMLGKSGQRVGNKSRQSANQSPTLYHGQPIMISENDYTLGLYNGDIGLIWRVQSTDGVDHLMASFQDESSDELNIRQILPSRLPKFETVYAMTIHKTQGSEFDHVAMAISPPDTLQYQSQLLSRELLYTGITRAKNKLTIASHQKTWIQGVNAQVKRNSGLVITLAPER